MRLVGAATLQYALSARACMGTGPSGLYRCVLRLNRGCQCRAADIQVASLPPVSGPTRSAATIGVGERLRAFRALAGLPSFFRAPGGLGWALADPASVRKRSRPRASHFAMSEREPAPAGPASANDTAATWLSRATCIARIGPSGSLAALRGDADRTAPTDSTAQRQASRYTRRRSREPPNL